MPRRLYAITTLSLALALLTAPAEALDSAEDRSVDLLLSRIEAAAVDPLTTEADVPRIPDSVEELDSRRNMALARAVQTLESSADTTLAILEGDVLTPLSLARNYRHLGMRRRALRWYEGALTADKHHEYTITLRAELSSCAAELGDSATIVHTVRDNLAQPQAKQLGDATAELLSFFLVTRNGTDVDRLFEDVESSSLPSARLQLVLARFWESQGEYMRARGHYRRLLRGGASLDLYVAARCLKGLADTTINAGDRARGRALYRMYQSRDAGRLSAWSTYRLGQLAVVDGHFERAAREFRSICEREDRTPWQADACVQLQHARQLLEIEEALDPYGLSLNFKRRNSR